MEDLAGHLTLRPRNRQAVGVLFLELVFLLQINNLLL